MRRNRGQLIELKKGEKYRVRVTVGYEGPQRKPITESETIWGSRNEARKALTALVAEVDFRNPKRAADMSLDAYLDQWLASLTGRVRPRTEYDYAAQLRRHIRPTLGSHSLRRLNAHHIQSVYDAMRAKGLSSRSIRITHAVLRIALKAAVERGLLTSDPLLGVKLPPKSTIQADTYFTEQQVKSILHALRGQKWELLFTLLLFTGLRISEAVALRRMDINLPSHTITVRRSAVQTRRQWDFNEPKNGKTRAILIPPFLEEMLAGSMPDREDALLFHNGHNKPPDIGSLRRTWKRRLQQANVPTYGLHAARHTHATLLLETGQDLKVIQDRLGHSSSQVTRDIYAHVTTRTQQRAVSELERVWRNSGEFHT